MIFFPPVFNPTSFFFLRPIHTKKKGKRAVKHGICGWLGAHVARLGGRMRWGKPLTARKNEERSLVGHDMADHGGSVRRPSGSRTGLHGAAWTDSGSLTFG
jgi:hypothetical protein